MACGQETLELLSCYVDGESSPEQRARAEAHLDSCAECRETVQEWRHGIEMLDWTYSRALPEDVAEPTFDAPMPAPEREHGRWSFVLPNMRILTAAAALILIAVVSAYVYQTVISLPTLGRSLATAQRAQTVLVAAGIRLEIEPNTEINRLGDKAIRLVQGTINAEVTQGSGFTIRTRKLEIIDEGTRFQVHSDPRTDRVTVKEGSVLVREGKDEYHVGAGETLTSTGDQHHNETRVKQNGGTNVPSGPHGGIAFGYLPALILVVLVIVFWVWMLVDALRREFRDSGTKVAWVIVLFFGHILGALIYCFVVYAKDPRRRRIRLVLVGRRADQRVILWWNALVFMLLVTVMFGVGNSIYGLVTSHPSKPWMLVGAAVGIGLTVLSILQALRLPPDKLTELGDGPPLSSHRPLRWVLVGRRGDQRVILWWNVLVSIVLAPAIIVIGSIISIGMLGGHPSKALLLMGAAAGIAMTLLIFSSALRMPLHNLTDLETGETPANRRRPLRLTLVGRRGDQRVVLWGNIVAAALGSAIICGLGSMLVHGWFVLEMSKATLFVGAIAGIVCLVAHLVEVLSYPVDTLTDLETGERTSPGRRNVRYPFPLMVARRNGNRVIIWWNLLRMARILYLFIACSIWIALIAVRGTSQAGPPLLYGLLAVAVIMSVTIVRLLRAPLDRLPSLGDDRPTR